MWACRSRGLGAPTELIGQLYWLGALVPGADAVYGVSQGRAQRWDSAVVGYVEYFPDARARTNYGKYMI